MRRNAFSMSTHHKVMGKTEQEEEEEEGTEGRFPSKVLLIMWREAERLTSLSEFSNT